MGLDRELTIYIFVAPKIFFCLKPIFPFLSLKKGIRRRSYTPSEVVVQYFTSFHFILFDTVDTTSFVNHLKNLIHPSFTLFFK